MIWHIVAQLAGYALFLPILWWAGNVFCRMVLATSHATPTPKPPAEPAPADLTLTSKSDEVALAAGRVIGVLERTLVLVGILTGRWEVIAGVVALKTVARYKELEKQFNAEYFLIGSLASILWAALVTAALILYDHELGFQALPQLRALLVGRP